MIKVITSPFEFKQWRAGLGVRSVGFVPTMGALHRGHATLLEKARAENDLVVLSIFVNPTQFNNPGDLKNYPQTWDQDFAMAEKQKVDVIFFPEYSSMYPDNYRYKITENDFSQKLCGAHRPGHFDGVLSVVMKLFQIVEPHKAYFGEKDYQQLKLIEGMVQSFFMNLKIVPVATVREEDGLAMSSRNMRLTPEQRKKAPLIYKAISTLKTVSEIKSFLEKEDFKIDYVEDIEGRRFIAAFLGEVRLIDNVKT